MNTEQLIKAAFALTIESAPQGLSADQPRQRSAGSPASLFTEGAALEKQALPLAGPIGGRMGAAMYARGAKQPAFKPPELAWDGPGPAPGPRPSIEAEQARMRADLISRGIDPATKPGLDPGHKVGTPSRKNEWQWQNTPGIDEGPGWATQDQISAEQGFNAPGGRQIRNPGFIAPVVAATKGALGGAGGFWGDVIGGIGQLGAYGTDALGITDHGVEAMRSARVPYQNAYERGMHQLFSPRTSRGFDDWWHDTESSAAKQGPGDKFTDTGRIMFDTASTALPYVVGKGKGFLGLIFGEMGSVGAGMWPEGSPEQQVLARLTDEEKKGFFDAAQAEYEKWEQSFGEQGPPAVEAYPTQQSILVKHMESLMQGNRPKPAPLTPAAPSAPTESFAAGQQAGAAAAQANPPAATQPSAATELPPTGPIPEMGGPQGAQGAPATPSASGTVQAPGAATGAPPAQPEPGAAPQQPPPAAEAPGQPPAAPQQPLDPAVAQMIYEGPVGDDAFQRAMSNPMQPQQIEQLTAAINSGQVPQEQVPRAVQQVIANRSIEKAHKLAYEQGIPVEQAMGKIARQWADGEYDADDLSKAFEYKAEQDAAQMGADPEQLKQDPGYIEQAIDWWKNSDWHEKLGLIVGVGGAVMGLINGLMGGDGMMTMLGGALGLGGLGWAFGGGDWVMNQFGGGGDQAAPEGAEQPPAGPTMPEGPPEIPGVEPAGPVPPPAAAAPVPELPPEEPPNEIPAADPALQGPPGMRNEANVPAGVRQGPPEPQTPEQAMADLRQQFGWVNKYGDKGGKKGILDSQADVKDLIKAWAYKKIPDQQMAQLIAQLPPEMRQKAIEGIKAEKGFTIPFVGPGEPRRQQMLQMLQ